MLPAALAADLTWETLIQPLAVSAEVIPGYHLERPFRGHEHDVVWVVRDDAGRVVEVHAVDRAMWPQAQLTPSFGVDYEAPRSTAPAADAEAVVNAIAAAIRANDPGEASVDAVPLGDTAEEGSWRRLLERFGTRGPVNWWRPAVLISAMALPRKAEWESAALFLVSLLLRFALGPWSTVNVNGQGAKWLSGAVNPAEIANYGPGYYEIYHWFRTPSAIFAANTVFSAMVPALVWSIARRLGFDRQRAAIAACLLMIDPVSIRIAASETYLTPILVLTTTISLLALAKRWVPILLIGFFAGALARLHPSAWVPLALAPLIAAPGGWRWLLAAAGSAGVGAVVDSGVVISDVLGAIDQGAVIAPVVTPASLVWALLPIGLALAVPRARPLALPVAAASAADALLRSTYDQSDLWQGAFDRLYAVPILLLIGAVVPEALLARRRLAIGVAAAVTLAIAVLGAPLVRARTTDDAEFAWTQRTLPIAPDGCRILYVARPDPVVTTLLAPIPHLELVAIDAQGPVNLTPYLRGDCVRYYRTSGCSTRSGVTGCEKVESLLGLGAPIERGELPAIPSHRSVSYRNDPVEVALFEVTKRAP